MNRLAVLQGHLLAQPLLSTDQGLRRSPLSAASDHLGAAVLVGGMVLDLQVRGRTAVHTAPTSFQLCTRRPQVWAASRCQAIGTAEAPTCLKPCHVRRPHQRQTPTCSVVALSLAGWCSRQGAWHATWRRAWLRCADLQAPRLRCCYQQLGMTWQGRPF